MTDKQILEEVHRVVSKHRDDAVNDSIHNHTAKLVSNFIEQEWQRQDDAKSLGQFSQTWYQVDGRRENKRHRELEIGEDGTVKKIL